MHKRKSELRQEEVNDALQLFAESFNIFPHPDEDAPKPADYASYLVRHASQGYQEHKFVALADDLATNPALLDAVANTDLQKLGGALIGVSFTQAELRQIAGEC